MSKKGIFAWYRNLDRSKPEGQIAVFLILALVVIFIFTVITINIGTVSTKRTALSQAADGAALVLASMISSYGVMLWDRLNQEYDKTSEPPPALDFNWTVCKVSWDTVFAAIGAIAAIIGSYWVPWLGFIGVGLFATDVAVRDFIRTKVQAQFDRDYLKMTVKTAMQEQALAYAFRMIVDDPKLVADVHDINENEDTAELVRASEVFLKAHIRQVGTMYGAIDNLKGIINSVYGEADKFRQYVAGKQDFPELKWHPGWLSLGEGLTPSPSPAYHENINYPEGNVALYEPDTLIELMAEFKAEPAGRVNRGGSPKPVTITNVKVFPVDKTTGLPNPAFLTSNPVLPEFQEEIKFPFNFWRPGYEKINVSSCFGDEIRQEKFDCICKCPVNITELCECSPFDKDNGSIIYPPEDDVGHKYPDKDYNGYTFGYDCRDNQNYYYEKGIGTCWDQVDYVVKQLEQFRVWTAGAYHCGFGETMVCPNPDCTSHADGSQITVNSNSTCPVCGIPIVNFHKGVTSIDKNALHATFNYWFQQLYNLDKPEDPETWFVKIQELMTRLAWNPKDLGLSDPVKVFGITMPRGGWYGELMKVLYNYPFVEHVPYEHKQTSDLFLLGSNEMKPYFGLLASKTTQNGVPGKGKLIELKEKLAALCKYLGKLVAEGRAGVGGPSYMDKYMPAYIPTACSDFCKRPDPDLDPCDKNALPGCDAKESWDLYVRSTRGAIVKPEDLAWVGITCSACATTTYSPACAETLVVAVRDRINWVNARIAYLNQVISDCKSCCGTKQQRCEACCTKTTQDCQDQCNTDEAACLGACPPPPPPVPPDPPSIGKCQQDCITAWSGCTSGCPGDEPCKSNCATAETSCETNCENIPGLKDELAFRKTELEHLQTDTATWVSAKTLAAKILVLAKTYDQVTTITGRFTDAASKIEFFWRWGSYLWLFVDKNINTFKYLDCVRVQDEIAKGGDAGTALSKYGPGICDDSLTYSWQTVDKLGVNTPTNPKLPIHHHARVTVYDFKLPSLRTKRCAWIFGSGGELVNPRGEASVKVERFDQDRPTKIKLGGKVPWFSWIFRQGKDIPPISVDFSNATQVFDGTYNIGMSAEAVARTDPRLHEIKIIRTKINK